jgi:hypothetical protein
VAATKLRDSAGCALSAVSVQRSASVLSFLQNFFAKCKEVTDKKLNLFEFDMLRAVIRFGCS